MIVTAAAADRTSFGCAAENDWTFFGDAMINHALRKPQPLGAAFAEARALVADWETRSPGADPRSRRSVLGGGFVALAGAARAAHAGGGDPAGRPAGGRIDAVRRAATLTAGTAPSRQPVTTRILILGGYGNFGSYIARRLAVDPNIRLLIGGRSQAKAEAFVARAGRGPSGRGRRWSTSKAIWRARWPRRGPISSSTASGRSRGRAMASPQACIAAGSHYLDLSDGRAFVAGIGALDDQARAAGVAVVAGASSVPCLTAAIVDDYRGRFARLDSLDYGISTAEQGSRGLATAAGVLSYVGKPFQAWRGGRWADAYGWQDLHAETYPELGRRLFGNADIVDVGPFSGTLCRRSRRCVSAPATRSGAPSRHLGDELARSASS